MPLLKFEVQADYDKVIKLREEIDKLQQKLLDLSPDAPVSTISRIEHKLASAQSEFSKLTTSAMLAGAEIEDSFKKRIYEAAQNVNGFSEDIIEQKNHIHSLESQLRKLRDAYKALPNNPVGEDYFKEQHLAKQIRELNAEIGVEKDALFGLTQAKARAALEAKKLSDEYKSLKEDAGDVTDVIGGLKDNLLKTGAKVLGGIGIGVGIKDFVSQVVSVRGEFQGIETSLKVLLKDEEKAAALMGEIKKFAAVSPLDLKSTAAAAQMMLGFNIEAEKVPRFLQAIGDVSMGDSAKFNSLTLAFSQMSATGKLMGQDLNQMINAGFNPLQAMADKTGKSIAELKEQMSKGAISAEMVQQAFIDATDAGGKFYNMSAEASKTINGQLSMLQDAIDAMFNEIGESSEGIIQGSIGVATKLVENYQTVGIVLSGLIATYGAYRAAIMLVTAAEKGYTITQMAQYKWLLLCEKAQKLLNASMLTNPYVLLATAVVAVGTAIYAYATRTSEAEKAQNKLNEAIAKADAAIASEESNINLLFNKLRNAKEGSEEFASAQKMIIDQYGDYLSGLVDEKNHLIDVELAYQRVAAAARDSANARAMESHTSELKTKFQEDYGDAMENITNAIRKKAKGNQANTIIELVRRDIEANGGLTTETQNVLGKLFGEKRGKNGWNDASQVRKILNQVSKIRQAQNIYDEGVKDANAAFGVMGNEFTSYSKEELQNMESLLEYQMEGAEDSEEIILTINGKVKETYKTLNEARLALAKIKEAAKGKENEDKIASENNLKISRDKAKKELDEAKAALSKIDADPSKYSKQEYEAAKQRKQSAEAAYKKLTEKTDTKAAAQAEKQENQKDKLDRQLQDLEAKNQQEQINLLEEGREKRLKIIEKEYQDRLTAAERQKEDWAKANKEAKHTELNAEGLTTEQANAIEESKMLAATKRDKSTSDLYKEEVAAMRDFLKEYGTFQQQKLAITEEYAEKIKKATTEGEKLKLAKERDAAAHKVDMDAIKSEIDWRGLFSGVGSLISDQLKPMLQKLQGITKDPDFQEYSLEEQQMIYDWINELQQRLGVDLKAAFEKVGEATKKYNEALKAEEAAKEESERATRAYYALLDEKGKNGTTINPEDPEIKAAFDAMMKASEAFKTSTNNATTALDEVQTAAQNCHNGMQNLVDGLQNIGSGNVRTAIKGLEQLISVFKNGDGVDLNTKIAKWASKLFPENDKESQSLIKKGLASIGTALGGSLGGEIVGMVFDLLDIFKDGIENLFASLIDTVLGAINGLLNTLLSLDLPLALFNSLKDGLENIFNTLTFGGFSHWIGTRESDKHYERDMEKLTESNERLTAALDRLSKTMEEASLVDVEGIANTQKEYLGKQEENLSEQIIRSGQAYKSDNFFGNGGHDSGTYYLRDMDKSYWQQIAQLLGKEKDWGSWLENFQKGDRKNLADAFLGLSADEMKQIADKLPSVWMEITERLGKGYKDATQFLEEFIAIPDQLREIEENMAAKLTDTSFDSVRDSFKSLLLDMDSDTGDFISNFEKSLQQAIINSMMSGTYSERLKQWYDNFTESMKDTKLSAEERDALKDEYDSIVADAVRERDALKSAFGWGSETEQQNATAGYAAQLSEDTGSEMVGRMTAMQDILYRIENSGIERNQLLSAICSQYEQMSITELSASQLESISAQLEMAYTVHIDTRRTLVECYLELQQIRENTGAIIKPINSMKESLEKIEKNTKDLA